MFSVSVLSLRTLVSCAGSLSKFKLLFTARRVQEVNFMLFRLLR